MTDKKAISLAGVFGLAIIPTFALVILMTWRAYVFDDAPPAASLRWVSGVPSSWGSQKMVGTIICMDDVPQCLRIPKMDMEKELVIDSLQSGLPVAIRYDPKSLSAWGARVYYSLYEFRVDQRVIISYDAMKEDLRSSRHFAQWAAAILALACIVFAVLAFRLSDFNSPELLKKVRDEEHRR
jgi:hypothetical protein